MAKFFGPVGFGETQELAPGNWDDVITERNYIGDIERPVRRLHEGDKVNDDISVTNSISILSDQYANEHTFAIRYVKWAGILWKVEEVDVQNPRLLLRLGGVYNGPTAPVAGAP